MVPTLFVKKLGLCIHLVEGCPESLLLCPLIPLAGPVCERELTIVLFFFVNFGSEFFVLKKLFKQRVENMKFKKFLFK